MFGVSGEYNFNRDWGNACTCYLYPLLGMLSFRVARRKSERGGPRELIRGRTDVNYFVWTTQMFIYVYTRLLSACC